MRDNNTYNNISTKRIIAIANQKGGVGKSTTAVNLTAYLGHFGFRSLIIDMDPQSNSTSGLGFEFGSDKKSIYNILISGENINDIIAKTRCV